MKQLATTFYAAVFTLATMATLAQKPAETKPALFKNYPSIINCTTSQLNNLFTLSEGQTATLFLEGDLKLQGPVKSNMLPYKNLQILSIRLPEFNDIILGISKRTEEDNSVVFIGHLFSNKYADGYELKRNADNSYQLVKIETEKLLQPCH